MLGIKLGVAVGSAPIKGVRGPLTEAQWFGADPVFPTPTRYVAANGNDANDGLTAATPWQTISKVNAASLSAGAVVAFRGGDTFSGSLVAQSSGSAVARITYTSYGVGRATISSGASRGFFADNKAYLEIAGLNFVGGGVTTNRTDGIRIQNSQAGNTKLVGPIIRYCTVEQYGNNGIWITQTNGISGFNGITIDHVIARYNTGLTHAEYGGYGTAGILVEGVTGYGTTQGYSFLNVSITYCIARYNQGCNDVNWTGSGIMVGQADVGLVENCIAHHNGASSYCSAGGPVGIWAADARAVVIRKCESYANTSLATDGCGFDLDAGSVNCILEMNYSHDNYDCGFLIYSYDDSTVPVSNNNHIRFNVSQNDARRGAANDATIGSIRLLTDEPRGITNTYIYDNVIFTDSATAAPINVIKRAGTLSGYIANNIFYVTGNAPIVKAADPSNMLFRGNDYYRTGGFSISYSGTTYTTLAAWQTATTQEKVSGVSVGYSVDPQLTSPGNGITTNGWQSTYLTAYKLKAESPMINAGVNLSTVAGISLSGVTDYYGNAANYSVGAHSRAA